jgi:hypothetical protein
LADISIFSRARIQISAISLGYAPFHVTDFLVVNVPVDELLSARIWQHKLCATLSATVTINIHDVTSPDKMLDVGVSLKKKNTTTIYFI